ncbi:hypothetical protein I6H48_06025 [Corynebacterium amycolatum]|uniref:Lipoprotein n=1 Tax=Corynebacterium amycolatum TaxID=43765 RepID=A0AB37GEG0_CORAY|nr:hypothetical protein [Corynebacterium amycolatum]MCQ9125955.1 hypothetical protein [Corynebacterium amycolatum]MCQ9166940.1 hypothetical protein [Corynebacterium amycolatum]MCQ9168637.1 hypothetical protein [Corynebacterium amycolatum]MCQ9173500.1 hypothetical protein [Corynebacterium amycolatum]MCQ9176031.1 hypothetical protein [Corynebacterium amycolatum]
MVKKAFGALLLAALPLSASLVGCSDSNAAKGANPENAGSQSEMETSAPLPPVPSDAELQQTTEPNSDSSLTETNDSLVSRPTTSSSTEIVEDPYLPPQAYIPPTSTSSSATTPTSTTSTPPTTTETTESTSDDISSPTPSKPVPLLPEDNSEKPNDSLPEGDGGAAAEPKPPSSQAQSQAGTQTTTPSETPQKTPSKEPTSPKEPTPPKDQTPSKDKDTTGGNGASNSKISPIPEKPKDSRFLGNLFDNDED